MLSLSLFSSIFALSIYIPSSSPPPPSPVFLIAKSMLKVRKQGVAGIASKHGYPLPPLPRNVCVFSLSPLTHKHTSFHLSHLNLCWSTTTTQANQREPSRTICRIPCCILLLKLLSSLHCFISHSRRVKQPVCTLKFILMTVWWQNCYSDCVGKTIFILVSIQRPHMFLWPVATLLRTNYGTQPSCRQPTLWLSPRIM